MDFIYGEISQKAVKNTYKGGKTDTAEVTVDNTTNTIYVNAQYDPDLVKRLVDEYLASKYSSQIVDIIGSVNPNNILTLSTKENIISCDLDNKHIKYIIASGKPQIKVIAYTTSGAPLQCYLHDGFYFVPDENITYSRVSVLVSSDDKEEITLGPLVIIGY